MHKPNLFSEYLEHIHSTNSSKITNACEKKTFFIDKNSVEDEGIFKFRKLKSSGFCTFYTGLSFWNINSVYFQESRHASSRIPDFIRVYIVKNGIELDNQYLIKQIELDIEAHAHVYICDYNSIPLVEAKKDFGIWDGEYVCVVHYDVNNVVTGATISSRPEDIKNAEEWKKTILSISTEIKSVEELKQAKGLLGSKKNMTVADRYKEFQLDSIEYQMSVAGKECTHSYLDKESCMWYHSSWPILRALNVVSTPNWHNNFYVDAIASYIKDKKYKPNILVSATADATILEHIESGLGNLDKANIWVVDLCPTPLAVAQKYAQSRGGIIHALQVDALHLFENGLRDNFFDLVITDAFITRFESEVDKKQLLRSWFTILKPGGLVITTCRITGKKKEIGSHAEIKQFVKKTSDAFDSYIKVNPTLLRHINKELTLIKSAEYAEHIVSNPISEKQIHTLFIDVGFSIVNNPVEELLLKKEVGGEFKATTYSQIIAKK